jgi:hypothetical protein
VEDVDVDNTNEDDSDPDEVKGDDEEIRETERLRLMRLKEEKEGWRTEHTPVILHPFNPPTYSPMFKIPSNCTTALDFFHLIIPPSFIQHITEQINIFAQEKFDAEKESIPPTRLDNSFITIK